MRHGEVSRPRVAGYLRGRLRGLLWDVEHLGLFRGKGERGLFQDELGHVVLFERGRVRVRVLPDVCDGVHVDEAVGPGLCLCAPPLGELYGVEDVWG